MHDTRYGSYLTTSLKRTFLLAQQQQQQQQYMTKAYHETEIKIQICLAEKVYSVKTKGNNRDTGITKRLGWGTWNESIIHIQMSFTIKTIFNCRM